MGVWKRYCNTCWGSVAAASLVCRTNTDETAVSQRAESDTNTAGGTGSDSQ